MRRRINKIILIIFMTIMSFTVKSTIFADDTNTNVETTLPDITEDCEVDIETGEFTADCFGSEDYSDVVVEEDEGVPFFARGIYSHDNDVYEKEKNFNYYKFYFTSFIVPDAIVLENHEGVALAESATDLLLYIMLIISMFFEFISHIFVLLDLMVTKIVYGQTMYQSVQSVLIAINNAIFDWNNPQGAGYVLTFCIIFFVIIRNTIRKWNEFQLLKFLKYVLKMIIMGILIVNSFTVFYKPMVYLKENISNAIIVRVVNFTDDDSDIPTEVFAKEQVFTSLELNSFLMVNFGYMNIEDMKNDLQSKELDYLKMYGDSVIKADGELDYDKIVELRINNVVNGEEKHLEYEVSDYNNEYILRNFKTASSVMVFTFISMVHTIFFVSVDVLLKGVLLVVQLIEYATYIYIYIPLINILFHEEDKMVSKFIANRFNWFILFIIINVLINVFLYAYNLFIQYIMNFGILSVLIFDIGIILTLWVIYTNKDYFLPILKNIVSNIDEGKGVVGSGISKAKDIVTGDYTVREMFDDIKSVTSSSQGSENTSEASNGTYDASDNDDSEVVEESQVEENDDFDSVEDIEEHILNESDSVEDIDEYEFDGSEIVEDIELEDEVAVDSNENNEFAEEEQLTTNNEEIEVSSEEEDYNDI